MLIYLNLKYVSESNSYIKISATQVRQYVSLPIKLLEELKEKEEIGSAV